MFEPRERPPSRDAKRVVFGDRKSKERRRDEKPRSPVGPRWRTDAPVEAEARAEEQLRCPQAARAFDPRQAARASVVRGAGRGTLQPAPKPEPAPLPEIATGVQTVTVGADEAGMRVDRFFEARFPGLSFSHIQRIMRKGEVRVNGKRVDTKDRLADRPAGAHPAAQAQRAEAARRLSAEDEKTRAFLKSITLHEDADVLVLNKPMGLSVQGGSGTTRHVDGMLEVLRAARARRAAAAAGAPARQGHGRLPAGRQDALCGRRAGEDLPLARGAQDLLGADRRRAEAAPGPHLDLPRQGRARGGFVHAHRAAWRGGREPRGDLLRGGRDIGAARSPGCRSSR